MGLTGNFGVLTLDGDGGLTVAGTSSGLDGCQLVSRNVAVHQNGSVIQGPTNLEPTSWTTVDPIAAAGFDGGDAVALALGCETYFDPENEGAVPTFVTFTWSQIVTITGK